MRRSLNLWLVLLLIVCGASLWFGGDLIRDREEVAGVPAGQPDEGNLTLATEPMMVAVLNGTPESGLARDFSLLLTRLGCVAGEVGNAPHDRFAETILVNRRLPEARARELAELVGGVPLVREYDRRRQEDAVLVLGADAPRLRSRLEDLVGQIAVERSGSRN